MSSQFECSYADRKLCKYELRQNTRSLKGEDRKKYLEERRKLKNDRRIQRQCIDCGKPRVGRPRCLSCQIENATHPQIMTTHGFPCDEKIFKLVSMLNDHRFYTANSCQDNIYNLAWIEFQSWDIIRKFKLLIPDDFGYVYDENCPSWRFPKENITIVEKLIETLLMPVTLGRRDVSDGISLPGNYN